MVTTRAGRRAGFSYLGRHRYVVTLRTRDDHPYFHEASTVRQTRTLFREAAAQTGFLLSAYCFMPDRLYLLVEGVADTADLRRFVTLGKQRTGHRHRRLHARRLWRVGYDDRLLGPVETTRSAARGLLRLPWREGLARDPTEYPFLGSDVWSVEEILRERQPTAFTTSSV